MRLLRRFRFLMEQRRHAAELAEEMEFHRHAAEQEQLDGRSANDARDRSRRRMGNMTQAGEDARAVWLAPWIESVFQDLAYGARALARQPGFTALAIIALALGIGLNTSLFTTFNAIVLRPWPVREPSRMVNLLPATERNNRPGFGGFPVAEYRYIKEHSRTLADAILFRNERVRLDQQQDGARSRCYLVTSNYFDVLGVQMVLGRGFLPGEDRIENPEPVAVLSYASWQMRYGGDRHILGKRIRIDDAPFTVVGVTSQEFTGTSPDPFDVWIPLGALPVIRPHADWAKLLLTSPSFCCSSVAGRLAPDATREQAAAELTTLAHQFQSTIPNQEPHHVLVVGTSLSSRPDAKRKILPAMGLMMAAVASVLLLACANVSNLLLARAAARQREIALRLSLGAGRWRIIRQLLTESLLLSCLAGGAGLALAYILPRVVLQYVSEDRLSPDLTPDHTVLFYTLGLSVLSAIAFGLAPAMRGTRVTINEEMKRQSAQGTARFPLRSVLLGVQVTISVVLLMSAGLFLRGLQQSYSHDPGFTVAGVGMVTVDLPVSKYDSARSAAYFTDLKARLEPLAGGRPVAFAALPPLANVLMMTGFRIPGQQGEDMALTQPVSPQFFDVMRIPILEGRTFTQQDAKRNVIIINQTMARRFWPSQSAVGQAIVNGKEHREIIGVVRDAELSGLGPVEPTFFEPFEGDQHAIVLLPADIAKQAGALVADSEPAAVANVGSLQQQLDGWLGKIRVSVAIAGALGLLALILASVGVYGVIAYSVEQRRREIGVRLALGGKPSAIVRFIVRANSRAVTGGLIVGVLLSLAASKLVQSTFTGVSSLDPVIWLGVLLLLFVSGLAASIVPARRAAKLDPLTALRHE